MFRTIYMPQRYFPDDLHWPPNRNEIVQKIEFLRLLKSLTDSNIETNFASHVVSCRHPTLKASNILNVVSHYRQYERNQTLYYVFVFKYIYIYIYI
jgi:hypothetical protein